VKMKQLKNPRLLKHQKGALLIVVLIILTIMTLGGISSMRSTSVETKLAIGVKSKLNALTLAENALKTGEVALCSYLSNNSTCTGAFVTDFDSNSTDGLYLGRELVNISGTSGYTSINSESAGTNQSYTIEYLDILSPQGSSLSIGNNSSGDLRYLFRVTAYGQSSTGGVSVVQSLYATRQ